MQKLILIKGYSYSTKSISARKGVAFYVEDDVAEELLKTQRFKLLSASNVDKTSELTKNSYDDITISDIKKMKKDELISLAEAKNIDLSSCSNNEERVETITSFLSSSDVEQLFENKEI